MGGDAHDGAGTVAGEDVVADVDGHAGAIVGVDAVGAGEDASLGLVGGGALDLGLAAGGGDIGLDFGLLGRRGELLDQLMLGGEDHEGDAVDGVGASGEDSYRLADIG